MKPRRSDTEAYVAASRVAREVRENIAGQLSELVLEGDQTGSGAAVRTRIELIVVQQRAISQARARQEQARELGLPLAAAVRDERGALEGLRSAAMLAAVALAEWVVAMDLERRREVAVADGIPARRRDVETI